MKISKDLELFRQDAASASSEAEVLYPHLTGPQGAARFGIDCGKMNSRG